MIYLLMTLGNNVLFRILLVISWFPFLPTLVSGQSFNGIVRDFETKQTLPYANIGVKKKNIGCISDKVGAFDLDLSKSNGNDTIVISYIGYVPYTAVIKTLYVSQPHNIELKPSSQLLKEVVVRGKPDIIVLGNKSKSGRHTGWGDFSSSRGRAIGLLIKTPDYKLKVSKVVFHLNACEFDSARVRVNLLKLEDGQAKSFESQQHNLFYSIYKRKGWIEVPLSDDIVVRNESMIVAIEWVDAWAQPRRMDEGGSYLFTLSLDNTPGSHYVRQTPEEAIQLVNSEFTPSIYLECFSVRE